MVTGKSRAGARTPLVLEGFTEGVALWRAGLAGALELERRFLQPLDEWEKADRGDWVTAADLASEAAILEELHLAQSGLGVMSEEFGETGPALRRWVIDPLDGTFNFRNARPNWSVSIALVENETAKLGGVFDVLTGVAYVAALGMGAWAVPMYASSPVPAVRLRTGCPAKLENATGITGFSNGRTRRVAQVALMSVVAERVHDLRQLGSAALDFCRVASGSADFYYEHGLAAWDLAAGSLIATEAGLMVHMDGSLVLVGADSLVRQLGSILPASIES